MKLVKVTGTPFMIRCRTCQNLMHAGDGYNAIADLEGKAWEAYYHADANCLPRPHFSVWDRGQTNIVDAKKAILKEIK